MYIGHTRGTSFDPQSHPMATNMGQAPAVICLDPSSEHEAPLKQNKLINRTYAGSIRLLQCALTGCFTMHADSVITPTLPSCFPSYQLWGPSHSCGLSHLCLAVVYGGKKLSINHIYAF